ncbi:MAG: PTS glucose transporter subunit IIA [Solobacterium sp.]|nr:PTS glucose transporter subunit IIA [Solobacterium sp.]
MGLFNLFKKEEEIQLPALEVDDDALVAIADGELVDIKTVSDPVFAGEALGKSIAFQYKSKVVLCSPANGTLSVLFPTGHAFGITRNDGVEILVHCGVDTVNAKGDGFKLMKKKQGDSVKAGDPIVEVDIEKLSKTYDMSTMLILTNENDKSFTFIEPQAVTRGQSIIK